jgi:hypothetical protein
MQSSVQRLGLTKSERVLVLHAPEAFEEIEQYITAKIDTQIRGRAYPCVFYFTSDLGEAEQEIPSVIRSLGHDALFWFCYPRKSDSITRTNVQSLFNPHGYQIVAQRHIDQQWTASRLRSREYMKQES